MTILLSLVAIPFFIPAILRRTPIPLDAAAGKKRKNTAMAYRKASTTDEIGYPGTYLKLARLYDHRLQVHSSTVLWLLACVEKCPGSRAAEAAE